MSLIFLLNFVLKAYLHIRGLCEYNHMYKRKALTLKSSLSLGFLQSVLSLAAVDLLCSFLPRAK